MIVLDQSQCVRCGSCVEICHEGCITLADKGVSIDYDLCSTCTQCIAICPRQALSWDNVVPVPFDNGRLPSPEQLDELFKQRRTTRSFKKDKIERALLEEIVSYGIYAPTNNYDLKAVAVDDENVVRELDGLIVSFVAKIWRFFYGPELVFSLLDALSPMVDPKDRVKMEETLARGHAFHRPPAIVFITGDKRVALSEASAQYALYNMILYAQAKGLGSCLWGGSSIFLDRSRAARKLLDLQRHERILGALGLGYPAMHFRNKVEGKKLPIRWIGEQ